MPPRVADRVGRLHSIRHFREPESTTPGLFFVTAPRPSGTLIGVTAVLVGVFGVACAVVWLVLLVRVMRRRPDATVRRELLRAWDDLQALLSTLEAAEELDGHTRKVARRAASYARMPIDLWPFGRSDDLVFALDAARHALADKGEEWLEERWPGDEIGLNALRVSLGLPARWEP